MRARTSRRARERLRSRGSVSRTGIPEAVVVVLNRDDVRRRIILLLRFCVCVCELCECVCACVCVREQMCVNVCVYIRVVKICVQRQHTSKYTVYVCICTYCVRMCIHFCVPRPVPDLLHRSTIHSSPWLS